MEGICKVRWRPDWAGVEDRAWILLWLGLLATHAILMGPVFSGSSTDPELSTESLGSDPLVTVDLCRDPLPRLLLISGIGSGLAGKIIEARHQRQQYRDPPFPCRCAVTRIPGVPDRALLEAGPWLLPLPCPGNVCLNPDSGIPLPSENRREQR